MLKSGNWWWLHRTEDYGCNYISVHKNHYIYIYMLERSWKKSDLIRCICTLYNTYNTCLISINSMGCCHIVHRYTTRKSSSERLFMWRLSLDDGIASVLGSITRCHTKPRPATVFTIGIHGGGSPYIIQLPYFTVCKLKHCLINHVNIRTRKLSWLILRNNEYQFLDQELTEYNSSKLKIWTVA